MNDKDSRPVTRWFLHAVLDVVAEAIGKRIAVTEARLTAIETRKGLEYRGTWRSEVEYGVNDCATYGGQLYLCMVQGTRSKPGDGNAWRLVSKKDLAP